jgi:hypothetical protein
MKVFFKYVHMETIEETKESRVELYLHFPLVFQTLGH